MWNFNYNSRFSPSLLMRNFLNHIHKLSTILVLTNIVMQQSLQAADTSSWVKISLPQFTVMSQLDEEATVRWTEYFQLFIAALGEVIDVDERALPPLDIVLFESREAFSPYRAATESGTVNALAGFFSNQGSWSVIGMPGNNADDSAQQLTYHEAVHWYSSMHLGRYPYWFTEGIAELFSTLQVNDNQVIWGASIPDNVDYLRQNGLQAMADFFEVSRDAALHEVDTFYPQAWLFLHYLLFGELNLTPTDLISLIESSIESDMPTVMAEELGLIFTDLDALLADYLVIGDFDTQQFSVSANTQSLQSTPASQAEVEAVLAKLAIAGNNIELGFDHAESLLELEPRKALTYDIIAEVANRLNEPEMLETALSNAIYLNSTNAKSYEFQAALLWEQNEDPNTGTLPIEVAREIANLLTRSILLNPFRVETYQAFVRVLPNIMSPNDADFDAIELGKALFPDEGIILIGEAMLSALSANYDLAMTLIAEANEGDYHIADNNRAFTRMVTEFVWVTGISNSLQLLNLDGRYADAVQYIDDILAGRKSGFRRVPGNIQGFLNAQRRNMLANQRITEVEELLAKGQQASARAILQKMINEDDISTSARDYARSTLAILDR
jgi:hypothetical protein